MNILAMFLSGLRSDDGHYNTAAWGNMLNAIDTVTGTPTPTISGFSGKYKVYYKSKQIAQFLQSEFAHFQLFLNTRLCFKILQENQF